MRDEHGRGTKSTVEKATYDEIPHYRIPAIIANRSDDNARFRWSTPKATVKAVERGRLPQAIQACSRRHFARDGREAPLLRRRPHASSGAIFDPRVATIAGMAKAGPLLPLQRQKRRCREFDLTPARRGRNFNLGHRVEVLRLADPGSSFGRKFDEFCL